MALACMCGITNIQPNTHACYMKHVITPLHFSHLQLLHHQADARPQRWLMRPAEHAHYIHASYMTHVITLVITPTCSCCTTRPMPGLSAGSCAQQQLSSSA
jgi:hypothetical protein